MLSSIYGKMYSENILRSGMLEVGFPITTVLLVAVLHILYSPDSVSCQFLFFENDGGTEREEI
jgi:hypothetical protein